VCRALSVVVYSVCLSVTYLQSVLLSLCETMDNRIWENSCLLTCFVSSRLSNNRQNLSLCATSCDRYTMLALSWKTCTLRLISSADCGLQNSAKITRIFEG